jgi:hypothetical protein
VIVPQKKGSGRILYVVILLAIVILTAGAVLYILKTDGNIIPQRVTQIPQTEEKTNTESIQTENVIWNAVPKKVTGVNFFEVVDTLYPYATEYSENTADLPPVMKKYPDSYATKAEIYEVGKMKTKYEGSTVYLGIVKNLAETIIFKGLATEKDIANIKSVFYLFIKTGENTYVLPGDYINKSLFCTAGACDSDGKVITQNTQIIYDEDLRLDSAESGKGGQYEYTYRDPKTGNKFMGTIKPYLFEDTEFHKIADFGDGHSLYTNQNSKTSQKPIAQLVNPIVVIRLPSGLPVITSLDVFNDGLIYEKGEEAPIYSGNEQLTWTANEKPQPIPEVTKKQGIIYTGDVDGCSGLFINYDFLREATETISIEKDLTQVATSDKGSTVYELTNPGSALMHIFWFNKVALTDWGQKFTYNDYVKLKPILVSKSPYGVYRAFFRTDIVQSKCWAEPLVYLYPKVKSDISLTLKNTNVIRSDPHYNNTWNVTAYPNGLLQSESGKPYEHLYWEGEAKEPENPALEVITSTGKLHQTLEQILTTMGLNERERKDFENYWEPKLSFSSYYSLKFYDESEISKVVPLTVVPKPDTVIRVLFSYEGLENVPENQVDIIKGEYTLPQRTGFTVVEWGGILGR